MQALSLRASARSVTSSRAAVALACVAGALPHGACGARAPHTCLVSESAAPDRAPTIRNADERRVEPPECTTNADCEPRPHAQMVCHHDASCRAICESHWGDCNGDRLDGCETATRHRLYCDGDPRIVERSEPTILFTSEGESTGPGKLPLAVIHDALDRARPQLALCYADALRSERRMDGALLYELTLGSGGCLVAKLLEDPIRNRELGVCLVSFFQQVKFSRAPEGGAMTSRWQVMVYSGGELTE